MILVLFRGLQLLDREFIPWLFYSLAILFPGYFIPWLFYSLAILFPGYFIP
jgi:hypothetical protein